MTYYYVKYSLISLNSVYLGFACLLIGLGAYARLSAYVTSISVVGGIIACGVFLFILAVLGIYGTWYRNQAILFFYIVLLFSLFMIQFGVACACLALKTDDLLAIVETGWKDSSESTKLDMMKALQCCGFRRTDLNSNNTMSAPKCRDAKLPCCDRSNATCCTGDPSDSICPCSVTCWNVVEKSVFSGVRVAGGVGLCFSTIELIGVWLAVKYRRLRDPNDYL